MPALLVKDMPPELHQRLKEEAARNHRSMAKQMITILEQNLGAAQVRAYPAPVRVAFPMTDRFLNKAKRWGRA